ncbi:Uncharacterized protein with protein kinase and helix-hairpin-helix DNA-binding domains [Serratia fonticola]|uniref:helix-hairpin-helix domain-containing protein n=1 Tax=Serratia fonticola TaxID=47917 RepID=UPI0021833A12|nr:helix-hairpin-helix domain-containing protein [Serratia fonticola]CAI2122075.1 Uncharacterized protein with protein kinase and helix-hairpin-helix DNA-binding domains [Serratia fonticola]
MMKTLFTSKGTQLTIGRELGKGGEGAVFEIPSLTSQVAKLYHKTVDPKKQDKLIFMASSANNKLMSYIAWPQETLHSSRGGPVVGFLMPKVSGKEPVHLIYSPAHRRQDNPKATWDFLLCVARNIAASFETVHEHGHVIGDVNQNSFMVGRDSKVVLIDSDSFQVNAYGKLHRCEVGVSHFTPPELQSLTSFGGVTRTPNHDNFGLALLIFHIIFGGRHPFSGVPLISGVGDALEADIKFFRYAYARDNQARGFNPPPRSISVSTLPDSMEAMFHLAFTERGVAGMRPSAQQWVVTLDNLRKHLRKCSASSMHLFSSHLGYCPWCELEKQGVVYFIDLGATYTPQPNGFVLARVWALIKTAPVPPAVSFPNLNNFSVKARSLPSNVPSKSIVTCYRLTALAIAFGIMVYMPSIWMIAVIIGWFGWTIASNVGASARAAETFKRRCVMDAARQEYDRLVEMVKKDVGPEGFYARQAELEKLRDEIENLPRIEKSEIDRLHTTARERQKQKYLNTLFIDNAVIPGLGPARKAALRSFGIETAADISKDRVSQVRGFGDSLTRAVLDWKASCERRFTFNSAVAVTQSDKNAVHAKFLTKRASLEVTLSRGASDLQTFRQRAISQTLILQPQLDLAARALAQAQVDLAAI